MRRLIIIFIFNVLVYAAVFSQVSVNLDGAGPDEAAILDVQSTYKGVLIPRMTYIERNAIANPSEGLLVYCTNCGLNESGVLCMFTGGDWYVFIICKTSTPTAGVNLVPPFSIIWTWHPVEGATGYKWGETINFETAIDVATDTFKIETGLSCDSTYTRYVWALSDCGYSPPLIMTETITNCVVCGDTIFKLHIPGLVAPVDKLTHYETLNGVPGEPAKCWITSNLGSDHQASAVTDATEASAGWYWQFNRMQGFKHDGTSRTPDGTWIAAINENSDWVAGNDPCQIELGYPWRVPTITEWVNVDNAGAWSNYNGPWLSILKIHAAGYLYYTSGALQVRGSQGGYWSSTPTNASNGFALYMTNSSCTNSNYPKAFGYPVRCISE